MYIIMRLITLNSTVKYVQTGMQFSGGWRLAEKIHECQKMVVL